MSTNFDAWQRERMLQNYLRSRQMDPSAFTSGESIAEVATITETSTDEVQV